MARPQAHHRPSDPRGRYWVGRPTSITNAVISTTPADLDDARAGQLVAVTPRQHPIIIKIGDIRSMCQCRLVLLLPVSLIILIIDTKLRTARLLVVGDFRPAYMHIYPTLNCARLAGKLHSPHDNC